MPSCHGCGGARARTRDARGQGLAGRRARGSLQLWTLRPSQRVSGSGEPRDVVLFVSGDGGWNLGVVTMAQLLTAKGTVVAGIDVRHYLHELEQASDKCVSPAVDFENLSHYLQSKLEFKTYVQPTLVGYSSGATLVYATLARIPRWSVQGCSEHRFLPGPRSEKAGVQGFRHRGDPSARFEGCTARA